MTSASDLKTVCHLASGICSWPWCVRRGASPTAPAGCLQTHALSWLKRDNTTPWLPTLGTCRPRQDDAWIDPEKQYIQCGLPFSPSGVPLPYARLRPGPPFRVGISRMTTNCPSQVCMKTLKEINTLM